MPDCWKLDATITEDKDGYWWSASKCGKCDTTASFYQKDVGYRCEDHH